MVSIDGDVGDVGDAGDEDVGDVGDVGDAGSDMLPDGCTIFFLFHPRLKPFELPLLFRLLLEGVLLAEDSERAEVLVEVEPDLVCAFPFPFASRVDFFSSGTRGRGDLGAAIPNAPAPYRDTGDGGRP